jgi:two-component system CheB/CheR fusion protein
LGEKRSVEDPVLLPERADNQRRVKNILAVVRLFATRTAEIHPDIEDFMSHFTGRLEALARAQHGSSRDAKERIDLEDIVREELVAHGIFDEQVAMEGPSVWLKAETAQALALALHELTVNAIKFGALGTSAGRLTLRWTLVDRALKIDWREEGVPALISRG